MTKYRRPFCFDAFILASSVASANCRLEKIGISSDHVHLLLEVPVSGPVPKMVEIIKSISSKKFAESSPDSWPGWQVGYYIASVGRSSKSKVVRYLENQ